MKKHFIHIPKNGGMSIRHSQELKSKINVSIPKYHISEEYTSKVKRQMDNFGDHHGFEHARWRDLDVEYREKHTSFAIIRNPWRRVESRFKFAKKVIEVEHKQSIMYADVSSFDSFLDERFRWGHIDYMWHRAIRGWYPALDHVTDEEGNIRCDILRLENINEELKNYFDLKQPLKPRNVTALGTHDWTDRQIQIVADWYKTDIDTFDFDFDTAARRNCYYEVV